MAHRELRGSILALVLLATVFLAVAMYANGSAPPQSSSSEGQQIGKVLSVRKVLRNPYVFSRYPRIHYYLLYFAVRASGQTYCSEYERRFSMRSMMCFLRRTKLSSSCSRAAPYAQNTTRPDSQGSLGRRKAVLTARRYSGCWHLLAALILLMCAVPVRTRLVLRFRDSRMRI